MESVDMVMPMDTTEQPVGEQIEQRNILYYKLFRDLKLEVYF